MNLPAITAILLLMTIGGAFGGFFLKRSQAPGQSVFKLLLNYNFYAGGFLYFAAGLLNILLLKYVSYIIILPLTALTYIWTLLIAKLFLHEKITPVRLAGVLLIIAGITLLVI